MPSVSGRINHKYSTEILILPHFSSKKTSKQTKKNKRKRKKKNLQRIRSTVSHREVGHRKKSQSGADLYKPLLKLRPSFASHHPCRPREAGNQENLFQTKLALRVVAS